MESWAARVQSYEYGRALMLLSAGQDPITVMTETGRRIVNKLEHHVVYELRQVMTNSEPQDLGADHYRQNYLMRVAPHADHIQDN